MIIIVAILRGDPVLTTLQFALVLTVAAIPVALPTVLSVTMAVGARKLAKKEAIVSRLVAVEELAGIDVLCSDKTGTLTQNKLTLGDPFTVNNVSQAQVILNAALASRSIKNNLRLRDITYSELVLRKSACLVRTEHIYSCQFLNGYQTANNCLFLSKHAPTAMVTDNTVGNATGIAATVNTNANCNVVRTGSPRKILQR